MTGYYDDMMAFGRVLASQGKNMREAVHDLRAKFQGLDLVTAAAICKKVYVEEALKGVEGAVRIVKASYTCQEYARIHRIKLPFEVAPLVDGEHPHMVGTQYHDPGYGPASKG